MALLAASALLLIGLWIRWPSVTYDGPATQEAYNEFAFDQFAYSDIASLYYRDDLTEKPIPYFDYPLEYPVSTGVFIYFLSLVTNSPAQYFLLSTLALAVCAVWVAVLVGRFPRGKLLFFALSPALALYVNLNWDMWGVLLMVVALYLFTLERDGWAGVTFAAATWTKFFPIVFFPFLLMEAQRRGGRRAAIRFAGTFALASAAINLPVALLAPEGWWHFFSFNAAREEDLNPWVLFLGLEPRDVDSMNALGMATLAAGVTWLLFIQRRTGPQAWPYACAAALALFFFVGKIYSPQYGLWVMAILAAVGVSNALAVAWSATDLLYFFASFVVLGLSQFGAAQGWFYEHAVVPADYLREGMLLVVIGWCIGQMRASAPEP